VMYKPIPICVEFLRRSSVSKWCVAHSNFFEKSFFFAWFIDVDVVVIDICLFGFFVCLVFFAIAFLSFVAHSHDLRGFKRKRPQMAETPHRRVLHDLIIGVVERVFRETPPSITSSSRFDAAFLLSRRTWTNDSDERLRGCGCGGLQANPRWNRGLSRQRGLR